jgi:ribosomal protein S18 acetylase RimI-like enzyme
MHARHDAAGGRPRSGANAPTLIDAGVAAIPAVSDMLGRAFFDDPVMRWLCPDDDRRRRALPAFYRTDLASIAKRGRVLTTVDHTGAAAWAAPDQWRTPTSDTIRGAVALTRSFGARIRVGVGLLRKLEANHPAEPHWHLVIIGTDPAARGRGVGGALIEEITRQCDATGTGAYLESSKAENVGYYERFGFTVTGELRHRDSPVLHLMWREPA